MSALGSPSELQGASSPLAIVRRVWQFLIQPTEPIAITSTNGSTIAAAAGKTVSSALTLPPAAATDAAAAASASIGPVGEVGDSGLSESLGLIGAIVAVQLAQYAWRRYQRATTDPAAEARERAQKRIVELTTALQLTAHPEGGFYRRIWQSPWVLQEESNLTHEKDGHHPSAMPAASTTTREATANDDTPGASPSSPLSPSGSPPPPRFHFPRPLATSIYFLLTSSHPLSHLHRLPADEQWVWVEGDPLVIVQVDPTTGEYTERLLGPIQTEEARRKCGDVERQHSLFMRPCSTAPTPPTPAAAFAAAAGVDAGFSPSALLAASHSHVSASLSPSFPTHVVPGGTWFGARLTHPQRHAPPKEPSHEEQVAEGWLGLFSPFGSVSTSAESAAAAAAAGPACFGYTLVCCVVSPGFQFEDFRLMGRGEFDRLGVRDYMRYCLRDAQVNQARVDDKLSEVQQMVLVEQARAEAMQEEATKPTMDAFTASH